MGRGALGFGLLLVLQVASAWSEEEVYKFFAQEAQVSTAALRPHSLSEAPATVYVLEGQELRTSGVQTLWDALRSVPGVDVMSVRTLQGAVSVRGLNKAVNNRTLVLVDGRVVLDGYLDNVNWESIPALMEEIERIEVVEGPASALYGANAINGAINIITRTPEQVHGGEASYAIGEYQTQLGSFLCGRQEGKVGYKVGLGWRSGNRFEDAAARAAATAKLHALVRYQLAGESAVSLSGGGTWLDTDMSLGGLLGQMREKGERGFLRADLQRPRTRLRLFWNAGRTRMEEFVLPLEPDLKYDTCDLDLEHQLSPGRYHELVVGAGYRRNTIQSDLISARHDLWALFGEDEWRLARRWSLWASLRLDHHPKAGAVLSPRFSAVFTPVPQQVLRFTAGTSFRNPTLAENHLFFNQRVDLPAPLADLDLEVVGNPELKPEQMLFAELAHKWQGVRLKTSLTGFHYQLRDVINPLIPPVIPADTEVIALRSSFVNRGRIRAWGGEFSAEAVLHPQVHGFFNYSYQRLRGELDSQVAVGGRPHHKFNGGLQARRGRLTLSAALHWVGRTAWNDNAMLRTRSMVVAVDDYTLVDAYLGYRVVRGVRELEVALEAFNLLDERHYETLSSTNMGLLGPGQSGELIRARRDARLVYRF